MIDKPIRRMSLLVRALFLGWANIALVVGEDGGLDSINECVRSSIFKIHMR